MKRSKIGDVAQAEHDGNLVYVQFVGKHAFYGDVIAVCPSVMPAGTAVSVDLFQAAYLAFYPLQASLRRGLSVIVGHLPSAFQVPSRLRRIGAMSGRRILTWVIEDPPAEEVVRKVLSPDEAKIPIAGIWNHEFLLARVGAGWRPELEIGEGGS